MEVRCAEKEIQLIRGGKQTGTVKDLRCRRFQEAPSRRTEKSERVATMIGD
jgi:hypothetical protein